MSYEIISEIKKIPRLSDDELNLLIKKYKSNDEQARQELIKHNLYIVASIALEQSRRSDVIQRGISFEDLFTEGCFGLMNAISEYDESKDSKFFSYAYTCVINEINKYINSYKSQKRDNSNDKSLQETAFTNKDGKEKTLEDYISDSSISVEEGLFNSIRDENLKNVLKRLTKEEREFIIMRFGFGESKPLTCREMAEILNVSRQTIVNKEEKILRKLRHPSITKGLKDFI